MRNIEDSKIAREASDYGKFADFEKYFNTLLKDKKLKGLVDDIGKNVDAKKIYDSKLRMIDSTNLDEIRRITRETIDELKIGNPNAYDEIGKSKYFDEISEVVGEVKFKYKNNPSDNPKVFEDAEEDINAIYGYRPSKTGSIKAFAEDDWSNQELVNYYKENRIKYHQDNDINIEIAKKMREQGKTDSDIARALVERRNSNRLASYLDENGNIIDGKKYEQALKHCKSYEELRAGTETKAGKTDLEIIESSTRGNPGMDACCGLYDNYYDTYN